MSPSLIRSVFPKHFILTAVVKVVLIHADMHLLLFMLCSNYFVNVAHI